MEPPSLRNLLFQFRQLIQLSIKLVKTSVESLYLYCRCLDYKRRSSERMVLLLVPLAYVSAIWGYHGPLDRYVKLWVAHAPGMPGTLSPPPRLAIPTCITARAWRTCSDACRDRYLVVSVEVGGGENVPGIPGAWATHNFTYLVRGPLKVHCWSICQKIIDDFLALCFATVMIIFLKQSLIKVTNYKGA